MGRDIHYWVALWLWLTFFSFFFVMICLEQRMSGLGFFLSHFKDDTSTHAVLSTDTQSEALGQQEVRENRGDVTRLVVQNIQTKISLAYTQNSALNASLKRTKRTVVYCFSLSVHSPASLYLLLLDFHETENCCSGKKAHI